PLYSGVFPIQIDPVEHVLLQHPQHARGKVAAAIFTREHLGARGAAAPAPHRHQHLQIRIYALEAHHLPDHLVLRLATDREAIAFEVTEAPDDVRELSDLAVAVVEIVAITGIIPDERRRLCPATHAHHRCDHEEARARHVVKAEAFRHAHKS